MSEWAKPELDRYQRLMLAPSLDEQLGRDCGVRRLDALLRELAWSEWEAPYARDGAGRPPIHPRLLAGCILYGLLKGIRSTRALEEATRLRLDFRWLLDGMSVDHTTLCVFRGRFEGKIGALFKQLNRQAAALSQVTLAEILIDGTRLRADSDRHGARTAETLEKRLTALEAELGEALTTLGEEGDERTTSRAQLEKRLERLEAEKQKIVRALAVARERDEAKRRKDGTGASSVRVPVTDPAASIMPNKEGGYAPNYTPVLAVDGANGLIVAACLAEGNAEAATVPELMKQVGEIAPQPPPRVLFDGGFCSGDNLARLREDGVEVYAPAGAQGTNNPAQRPDPTLPVPEAQRSGLPLRGGQLDRCAFVYDAEHDCYHCPMGREMPRVRTVERTTDTGTSSVSDYRCKDCGGCPLTSVCIRGKASVRMVSRDAYEPLREELAVRMRTEAARRIYARRAPIGEGVFATLKANMGIRRFRCRGRGKVGAELLWICMAYNLMKLIRNASTDATTPPKDRRTLSDTLRSVVEDIQKVWKGHIACIGGLRARLA